MAKAWTFSPVPNGQCGPLTVTWAGGKGPYTATIHPIGGTGKTYNIPPGAVSSGQGSFELTLQVAQGKQFLVTMGDADGPLTGGTSNLLTAGAQPGNAQTCNATAPSPNFFWSANAEGNIHQCQTYPFTDIGTTPGAKIQRPTTLQVLVPGGDQSFQIEMPNAPSFAWVANVKAGTSVVFDLIDGQGNQGGVGSVYKVQNGDSSCTLHNAQQRQSTAAPGATGTSIASGGGGGKKLGTGALAGIAVGAVVILGLIAVGAFLLFRKRKKDRQRRMYHDKPVDLVGPNDSGYGHDHAQQLPPGAIPNPYTNAMPSPHAGAMPVPYAESSRPESNYQTEYSSSSNGGGGNGAPYYPAPYPSKSQQAAQGGGRPGETRLAYDPSSPPAGSSGGVIVHRDIADDEPVELPPQYSTSRQPLEQFSGLSEHGAPSDAAGSASGTQRSNSMRKGPR